MSNKFGDVFQMTAVVEAVDLFCGAGGLSYGLLKAGVIVRAGLDFDGKCEFPFTENVDLH
ncbi:hypothetical protein [Agrobacterium sp. 22-226-1]